MSQTEAELLYEGGQAGANIYYASGFMAPDAFAMVQHEGRKIGILSDLEIGRAGKEGRLDELVSMRQIQDALKANGTSEPRVHNVLAQFFAEREITRLTVPESFPFGLAEKLREHGLTVGSRSEPFYPQRELKNTQEVAYIRQNQADTEKGMARALELIAAAEVGPDGALLLDGAPLTSERVKHEISVTLLSSELLAFDTIVAGGDQGCDPHCMGSGPLYANQTIIVDIFPRSITNQYWADITRTVYKGNAPDQIHQLYEAVAAAQQAALEAIKDGVDGREVHQQVKNCFEERDYQTGSHDGVPQGFFHGTGHGLGLEIHERPRIADAKHILKSGMTVTVEPGLYYPGLGGVRIEDLVLVTQDGIDNLTSAPKVLEL